MKNENLSMRSASMDSLPIHQLHWIKEVEQYVLDNIDNSNLVVADLARAFALSERQFHRRVKQTLGMTPNLFIRRIKMSTAKKMLEQGKCSTVSETAFAVGYNQPDYFSRLFMQWYGTRPIDYLRVKK